MWGRLIPWNVVGAMALVGGGWFALDSWGDRRYAAGAQVEKDAAASALADANQKARDIEAQKQGEIDAQAKQFESDKLATDGRVAGLATDGERLRDQLRAARARVSACTSAGAPGGADGAARSPWELLETLDRVAEGSAADAERLAAQVRALQRYAAEVSKP